VWKNRENAVFLTLGNAKASPKKEPLKLITRDQTCENQPKKSSTGGAEVLAKPGIVR